MKAIKGLLKKGEYKIGRNKYLMSLSEDTEVEITDQEDDRFFGRRYKIKRHDEWYEENCFRTVTFGGD